MTLIALDHSLFKFNPWAMQFQFVSMNLSNLQEEKRIYMNVKENTDHFEGPSKCQVQ